MSRSTAVESPARTRILDAARALFAVHGYTGTTLRAVAADAGCDVALIPHYFGNKQGLFDAATDLAVPADALRSPVLAAPLNRIGRAVAQTFITVWESPAGAGLLARLRSVLDITADGPGPLLEWDVWEHVRSRLEEDGVDRPELRIELAAASLLGVVVLRRFRGTPQLADLDTDMLIDVLAPVLQHQLTGELRDNGY